MAGLYQEVADDLISNVSMQIAIVCIEWKEGEMYASVTGYSW